MNYELVLDRFLSQVEETVYDRALKCTHSYHEKCHMTFITDYLSTTEEKCETSFVKECHITFKPMVRSEPQKMGVIVYHRWEHYFFIRNIMWGSV